MKKLLTIRDILLSALAGYAVYTYPKWASETSAVYAGIVVAVFCGCVLVALNNSERKMRRRDGSPRSADVKNNFKLIIGN